MDTRVGDERGRQTQRLQKWNCSCMSQNAVHVGLADGDPSRIPDSCVIVCFAQKFRPAAAPIANALFNLRRTD
jgi:hypothetical protein